MSALGFWDCPFRDEIGCSKLLAEVPLDEPNNNLSVVFDPLGTVLFRLAAGPTFNDPNTRSAAI